MLSAEGFPLLDIADRLQARVELPSPDWLAADASGVWVRLDGGYVDLIDPETNKVVADVDTGGDHCQGIGVGFGSTWTCAGPDLVRIDQASRSVTGRFAVGKTNGQGHIPCISDRVWVLVGDGSKLAGVDPASGEVVTTFDLGGVRGTDAAAGAAGLWVVSNIDGVILRIDTDAGVVQRIPLEGASAVVVTDEVWVGGSSRTVRVDPSSGEIMVSSDVGPGSAGAIAVGDGEVWVRRPDERLLVRLDPSTGMPIEGINSTDHSVGAAIIAFGSLWTSLSEEAATLRLHQVP